MISDDARANMMFQAHRKSVFVAYLLWFFFGMFSIHRFYLRHWLTGLTQMSLGILGPFTMIGGTALFLGPLIGSTGTGETMAGIGTVALGLWFISVFADAIFIPRLVRQCNETIVHQLTDHSTESGPGRDPSSFNGVASSRPSAFVVIGAILVLAGAVGVGFLVKSYTGSEAGTMSASGQQQALTETSETVDPNYAEADPASVEYDDSAELAAVEDDPPLAADEDPNGQSLPVAEQVKEEAANFDFQAAPIVRAKQRAVEKGKAIRWSSEAGSGYAVPSSITEVQGRTCRTVYVTFAVNGQENKSPSETLCRISSGNWETVG